MLQNWKAKYMHISETGNNNIKQIEYRSHMLEGENHSHREQITWCFIILCFNEAVHSKLFKTALGLTTVGFRVS